LIDLILWRHRSFLTIAALPLEVSQRSSFKSQLQLISTMNIPSPAITTESITPQDPNRTKTTTTVTLPDESSSLVAPLMEYRNANHMDDAKDRKNRDCALGTCMALAELVSEIFELVNDTAFEGIIEGRPDEEGGSEAFLGFIGVNKPHNAWKDDTDKTSLSSTRRTKRALSKISEDGEDEERDAPSSKETDSIIVKATGQKPMSSHSSVSSRVKKYFGESPLARRRREKNSILEAMRRAEHENEYLSDPSLCTTEGEESGGSYGASLDTSTGEDADGKTFDTHDTESVVADDERTPCDDAPRDGIDITTHDHRHAFPPVVQKFHSLNPLKPTMISKYNKQWPPLQFPSEANEFDAFNEEIKNHSSSSGHLRTEDESIRSYRDETPPEDQPQEEEAIVSTKPESFLGVKAIQELSNQSEPNSIVKIRQDRSTNPEPWVDVKTTVDRPTKREHVVGTKGREDRKMPPPSPRNWFRKKISPEDNEEHLISTSNIKKKISNSDTPSNSSKDDDSVTSSRRMSFWRPTVLKQLSHEDTVAIPLTPDRISQIEENKKRVQRTFQWRIKHHQAMIVRQRLAKRTGAVAASD
jgi:hypothetical protein